MVVRAPVAVLQRFSDTLQTAHNLGCLARGERRRGRRLMDAIVFLIPIAFALGALFAFLLVVAVSMGRFEDLGDPPK